MAPTVRSSVNTPEMMVLLHELALVGVYSKWFKYQCFGFKNSHETLAVGLAIDESQNVNNGL